MTITQLKVFVKIAETGSFTKAGQALNMTQPAVSHAISAIEAELDVKLIIRMISFTSSSASIAEIAWLTAGCVMFSA